MTISPNRPSPIAGQWYESDPKSLAASVDTYLDQVKLPEIDGEVIAVMAPHAGHVYSGSVAGYAFASVRGKSPDVVVIIGPMHHPYRESILVTSHQSYSTPLGDVSVDRNIVDQLDAYLWKDSKIRLSPISRDPEHSLEIVLPFLQRALKGNWTLVPLMLREQTPRIAEKLGSAISQILRGKNFLLVASTDLSHFYNEVHACKLDKEMLRQVKHFSPEGIFKAEQNQTGFACGYGALATILIAAKALGANKMKILKHATSGPITGDFNRVVGYGAAVAIRPFTYKKEINS